MNVKAFMGLTLFCLSATATARDLTPAQKAALCKIQSTVNQLQAVYDDRGGVVATWQRVNPGGLLQYRLPPRSYPVETRIALDGDAMQGKTLENAWYDALGTADRPQWFFPLVPPGEHTVSVAQKNECGEWDTAQVAVTSGVNSPPKNDVPATNIPAQVVFEADITAEQAQDLSAGANLRRYADCMIGSNVTKGKAAVAVIRRQAKRFILKFVTSPLTIVNHGRCLIVATGGLQRPPDPDEGIMICQPEMGMYTQCPAGWETFYKSSDGTEALGRMGPGPAPTAEGRDDQARLSCLAVIYNKYNEYGRDLDRAFEDRDLINQGCNKAVPAGSR